MQGMSGVGAWLPTHNPSSPPPSPRLRPRRCSDADARIPGFWSTCCEGQPLGLQPARPSQEGTQARPTW